MSWMRSGTKLSQFLRIFPPKITYFYGTLTTEKISDNSSPGRASHHFTVHDQLVAKVCPPDGVAEWSDDTMRLSAHYQDNFVLYTVKE